jgi:hypothetical protein
MLRHAFAGLHIMWAGGQWLKAPWQYFGLRCDEYEPEAPETIHDGGPARSHVCETDVLRLRVAIAYTATVVLSSACAPRLGPTVLTY